MPNQEIEHAQTTIGRARLWRRTARAEARRLNHLLYHATLQGPVALAGLIADEGLPKWVMSFHAASALRGPFGWRVVASAKPMTASQRP